MFQNHIERINNIDCLHNIQFFTLAGNRISIVENLSHLKQLLFLDLSSNRISDIDEGNVVVVISVHVMSGRSLVPQLMIYSVICKMENTVSMIPPVTCKHLNYCFRYICCLCIFVLCN